MLRRDVVLEVPNDNIIFPHLEEIKKAFQCIEIVS